MTVFNSNNIGRVFSWKDISNVHKVRNGIFQKKGKLVSLLTDFGEINACYPDFTGETKDTIFYTGAGRRGDQKRDVYHRSLHYAIETAVEIPLFCKLKVNQWKFMGYWRVVDAEYVFEAKNKRNIWSFVLKRV